MEHAPVEEHATVSSQAFEPHLPNAGGPTARETHTVQQIETQLQEKLVQHTSRDSDKFRQILRLFQQQGKHEPNGVDEGQHEGGNVVGISEENFSGVLAMLDVWATKPQAKHLFEKYDMNGDGRLTAHEFVSRCRPVDYDTSVDGWNLGDRSKPPTGKRIYDISRGTPTIPMTPGGTRLSVNKMARDLREKFNQQYPGRLSMNSNRAKLNSYFQYYDRARVGVVGPAEMKRALDAVNFNIGDENMESLYRKFSHNGDFDYREFSDFVFPIQEDATLNTSLEIGQAFYDRQNRERSLSYSLSNSGSHPNMTIIQPRERHHSSSRLYKSSLSDAQLKAFAMQRPGLAMPNSARTLARPAGLPTLHDGPASARPHTANHHRGQDHNISNVNLPLSSTAASGPHDEGAQHAHAQSAVNLSAVFAPHPPPRPATAQRFASTGNLGPARPITPGGVAGALRNNLGQMQEMNFRPPSQAGFRALSSQGYNVSDVSPIPSAVPEPTWTRAERPQTGNLSARPASRAGHAPGGLQNHSFSIERVSMSESPYFSPQPINQSIGIPAVAPPKLRKIKKLRGKTHTRGRPRPPPLRQVQPYERPSFSVY